MLSSYPACFYKKKSGYSVIFPDLPAATCGDTLEEALEMAIDCLAGWIHGCKIDGTVFPTPSNVKAVKFDTDFEYEEAFVNIISVDVEAYARTHFNKSVKKTLTIPE